MDTGDLEQGVLAEIIGNVPSAGGRVFATFTAPANTERPYIEADFSNIVPAVNPKGMFYELEVLCIGNEVDTLALDAVADEVVDALHDVHITSPGGREFYCTYTRDGRMKQFMDDIKALVVRLSFLVPTDFWTV